MVSGVAHLGAPYSTPPVPLSVAARVLLCPQCGSRDVHYELGGITGQVYRCKTCNYVGSLILEQDVEDDESEAD